MAVLVTLGENGVLTGKVVGAQTYAQDQGLAGGGAARGA